MTSQATQAIENARKKQEMREFQCAFKPNFLEKHARELVMAIGVLGVISTIIAISN